MSLLFISFIPSFTTSPAAVPEDPAGPIDLIIPMDSEVAGLYMMDPEPAIPKTNEDNTTERFPTGFVVIVAQFTGSFSRTAFWMVRGYIE